MESPQQIAKERWTLAVCILASSMAFIDGTALNVAMPTLQKDMAASANELVWIVNAYAIPVSALLILFGSLGDLWGTQRVFFFGIVAFVLSSCLCGLSPTTETLILSRALQGLSAAIMIPLSLAFLTTNHRPQFRGRAIGTWSSLSAITTIIGPVVGGILADAGLWRWIFFLNVPFGLLSCYGLIFKLKPTINGKTEQNSSPRSPDFLGGLLVTAALGCLSFVTIEWNSASLSETDKWTLIFITVVSGMLFVWQENRTEHPMVPLHLFERPIFRNINMATFFIYGALGGFLFFLPLNLVQIQGYSPSSAGLAILPFAIGISILSPYAGGLADKIGSLPVIAAGTAICAFGYGFLSLVGQTSGENQYFVTFFPGILILAAGMGLTVAPLTAAVMGCVSDSDSGIASGVNNAASRTASVLSVAVFSTFAVIIFREYLLDRATQFSLTKTNLEFLSQQANFLAEAKIPPGLSENATNSLQQDIRLGFLSAYSTIGWIATLMCAIASALAAITMAYKAKKT